MKKNLCLAMTVLLISTSVFAGCNSNQNPTATATEPAATSGIIDPAATEAAVDPTPEASDAPEVELPVLSKAEIDVKADEFMAALRSLDFEGVYAMLDEEYVQSQQITVDMISGIWTEIMEASGAFLNEGKKDFYEQLDSYSYEITADYENRSVLTYLNFKNTGSVSQISFDYCARTIQLDATDLPEGVSEDNLTIAKGTKFELNAKLTYPKNVSGEIPAVVLVASIGSHDMDGTVSVNVFFKNLAYSLAEKGIAVLRYDNRTFAHASAMFADPTIRARFGIEQEVIEDAVSAVSALKDNAPFKISKTYVLGHHVSGMLAPRIAAEGKYDGAVIMAGSSRNFLDIVYSQYMAEANQEGADPAEAEDYVQRIKDEYALAMGKKPILDATDPDFTRSKGISALTDEELEITSYYGLPAYYLKSIDSKPSSGYLQNMEKPILILHGSKDIQMSPEDDFGGYKAATATSKDATIKLYDGLNHLFMKSTLEPPSYAEYDILSTVSDEVTGDIAQWIKSK